MPSQKGKGCPASHRYRPASEYDDATLAQKREYWRNKKREQRARMSEQRKKSTQDSSEEKLSYMYVSAGVNTNLSDPLAALSSPLLSNDISYSSLSKSERTIEHSSTKAPKKQERHQAMTVSKVLRNLQPTSCSILATAAEGGLVTVKRPTTKSLRNLVTSSKSSGTELNTSSSVPPVRVTPFTSSSSTKTEPKPCGSMQDSSVPNTPSEAQVALNGLQVLPCVTTDTMHAALCGPAFNKTEGQRTHTTPQSGLKSALVTIKRATCFGITPASMESEEERAAKRREHWRIKKREQRAKLAAKTTEVRERPQNRDGLPAQKTTHVANSTLTSQSFLRGTSQKRNPVRVKVPYTTVKLETDNLQRGLAVPDLQTEQIKVQNPHGHKMEQTVVMFNTTAVRKPAESQKKLTYVHHSNITQETSSCKTLRQRYIETQKNFLNQRNLRNKPFLTFAGFRTRAIPTMDTNDTPEQILAKRREYWRNKKREQRANLSLEKKIRLKEKDSLTRRVKRYQQILEEMRKARALAHSTEKTPTLASEAIGGFIKEDGTLTINIPQSAKYQSIVGDKTEEKLHDISKKMQPTSQTDMNWRSVSPCRVNRHSPLSCSSQGKAAFSFVQTVNKTSKLIAVKPQSHLDITSSSSKPSKSVQQLTLTHLQSPQNAASAAGSKFGGCVMKMSISSHTPSLPLLSVGPKLSEEERMAKKREYWRTKKREQRAARASRLKHSIFQARTSAGLLRRRVHTQELNTVQPSTNLTIGAEKEQHFPNNSVSAIPHADEIKQEGESVPAADLNSLPDRAICPDKPPTAPPAPPELEPETSLNSDSQATTLLAVASMKKLLEESLSSVSENQIEQAGVAIGTTEDALEQDIKPVLSQLHCEKNDKDLLPACLRSQIKSLLLDSDVLEGKDLPNPQLSDEVPSLSASGEVAHSACTQSSQTTSAPFITTTSSCGTQRSYSSNWAHQSCWSEELPKLHHITTTSLDPLQQHHLDQHDQQSHNNSLPPAERFCSSMTRTSSSNSLQKREYWKLMKRQQRARLKARQKEILSKNTQAAGLDINVSECVNPSKPSIQSCSSVTDRPAMSSVPDILVGSLCKTEQSPDTHCVKPPIISREGNMNDGPSSHLTDFLGVSSPHCQKWTPRATETETASSLPTLKPPDNPLTSIHLQPIELPDRHQNPILSPIKISCAQLQSPINKVESSAQAASICIMMPPKPIPGASEEDFLKRKREYWRLKKKEQRAKKAFQYKGCTSMRASSGGSSSDLPGQDLQTLTTAMEDSSQWVNSSDASENLMSIPVDPDPPPFMYTNCPAQVEDEADILFADHADGDDDHDDEEEDSMSEEVWRNRYLMDYDPLNQLLVCMVCGELQYSHSLEGVRAHIDEAHPLTLRLEPREKQRILEAWDEQVSQRERFFSSQLQQHCGAAEETYRN
ncbi:uncharacterized protein LOC106956310 isoform X1 [Poecilia latipinna]|uniref:uncharacterized protein LOC106956310 isoform X1 n=1 Tax=Poecilia latipinna TaxID=48699 RepID=UPI00072E6D1A|nr:PREDICTED: uncharacterized protein LOC106956310 isoform X1 [Poecilia latipinna]XP_014902579.1 PREDICTED: uncharacterized protein LOC106956310 isoform X1 [Poecilia latipinna]XP_014902587.1 PREDICTED: uncharacterized protein LOC106956310 isoform X1 [Poecilia latipinna]